MFAYCRLTGIPCTASASSKRLLVNVTLYLIATSQLTAIMGSLTKVAERLVFSSKCIDSLVYKYTARERNSRVVDDIVYASVTNVFKVAVLHGRVRRRRACTAVLELMSRCM
jgi:hypothetical protein